MQIQINTGHDVPNDDTLHAEVDSAVAGHFERLSERITRIEVHLTDVNGDKGGRDTRCVMEARVAGMPPVAVDDQADTVRQAVRGAAGKLARALDSRLGRADRR